VLLFQVWFVGVLDKPLLEDVDLPLLKDVFLVLTGFFCSVIFFAEITTLLKLQIIVFFII
jgi:hypothetical protein